MKYWSLTSFTLRIIINTVYKKFYTKKDEKALGKLG